jgi:hypothetical protein
LEESEWSQTTIHRMDNLRSDPRERRWMLRFLDLLLMDEMRDAGAVSLDELVEMAGRPFHGGASRETIEEWWEYARRRSWIEEQEGGRWRVSGLGREELHERRRRASQPDPLTGAKAVIKWGLPAGVFASAVVLSGKSLTTGIVLLVICGTIALSLLIVALIVWFVDPPMDRWIARRACDWLDGRRVRLWIRQLPAVEGEVRRLYRSDEPKALVAR